MKIGFDISVLYIARAGVYEYRRQQLAALLKQSAEPITLLDYLPLHRGQSATDSVQQLLNNPLAHHWPVHGLPQPKLARAPFIKTGSLGQKTAIFLDQFIDQSWGRLAQQTKEKNLAAAATKLDLIHYSDVLHTPHTDCKTVITLYDLTTRLFPADHTPENIALQEKKYRFAQQDADAVIAISESARQDGIRLLGLAPEKVHVAYGGVGTEFRPLSVATVRAALAPLSIEPGNYLLHVGTLEPRKNLLRLVQAYHLARQQSRSLPPLILAGGYGWYYEPLLAEIKRLNLEKIVRLLGKVDGTLLPALYNGARCFLYPSLYEGFGLPPLEAMACGTPVIAANSASLPEVVGNAGLLVEAEDVDRLSQTLLELLASPEQQKKLREAGKKQAAQFSWDATARQTMAIYRHLCNS